MSETKFTRGEWKALLGTPRATGVRRMALVATGAGRFAICCLDSGDTYAESRANASLVAAAPDLYAALEAFLAHYAKLAYSGDCGNWNPEDEDEFRAASAALAKARGEK